MGLCLTAVACQTPAEHEAEADRDVYALVAARRAELEADPDAFDLRPDPESLRARLLAGEAPPDSPIGLTECLQIAAENSRDYQERKESLYLTALDLTLERYRLGWIPAGTLSTTMLGRGSTSEEQTATVDLGFSRLLGDGGQIVAAIGVDFLRMLSGDADWSVNDLLSLSFTQPLLGGAGQRIILEPLTQAERNLVYEVRSYERFRRTFAVDVAARYYQVLQQVDAAENARVNYENLKQLAERNRALADAGRLDDLQKGQVVQDELRSEDRLMSTRASLASTLDEFKLFLGLPVEVELQFDSAELARMGAAEPRELELDERVVIAVGMSSRLDYQTVLDQLEDAERRVEIAADALRAGLDLVASSGTLSTPQRPG
jgi:hypothetical protein